MVGLRTLGLLVLIVFICVHECEAGKRKKPCKYNGKKYKAGAVIEVFEDNCVEFKCSMKGKKAEHIPMENCVCRKEGGTTPKPTGPTRPAPSGTDDVMFTFVNRCKQDLWMGGEGRSDSRPSFVFNGLNFYTPNNGGWYLPEGATSKISIPYDFTAGRFWARTGCTGTPYKDFHCETGDCGPWIECSQGNTPRGGQPPATLAEITLNGWDGFDYYDISLVDGFNLPMEMVVETYDDSKENPNSFWCVSPTCLVNINGKCPKELQVKNSAGKTVACHSGCSAFNTDQYCCRGVYGTPASCIPENWPVNYFDDFYKAQCPQGYGYAWDHNTADFVCRNTHYKIYFC